MKFLCAKIWYPPPQMRKKTCRKSSKLTLFPGGGGERNCNGQNDFLDIWAFLLKWCLSGSAVECLVRSEDQDVGSGG